MRNIKPILFEEAAWRSSPLSIAKYYGGINAFGASYTIVNKDGITLAELSDPRNKHYVGDGMAIPPGEPAEETMRRLREQHLEHTRQKSVAPPNLDVRHRLALALMRADSQIHCRNCRSQMHPCRVYNYCNAPERPYFYPKQNILDNQMKRVTEIINEIKKLQL